MLSNQALVESRMVARRRDAAAHRLVAAAHEPPAPRSRRRLPLALAIRRIAVTPHPAGCT